MPKHLTVRMAWHDHGWDGTICQDPSANSYCTGSHSLLSERVARDKQVDREDGKHGQALDVLMPEYLPPCYWTSAAFSTSKIKAAHDHPFSKFRKTKRLSEDLPPNSVFTWPFRLSLTHSKGVRKRDGQYFADVDDRVDRYIGRLQNGESLVFFYLNYDNPISADEYRYALVGCSVLSGAERSGEFKFTDDELEKIRSGENMQNFPTRNWAIRVSHDFAKSGIRLPYHEYLRHVADHPSDEEKLGELRVLIEEPALLPGFKYVSEQLTDDQCLYLLYKLRRAFKAVERHGIVNPGNAVARIEAHIERLWDRRGLYPGLGVVVGQLARLADGDTDFESEDSEELVAAIRATHPKKEDLLDTVFALLNNRATPASLADHKKVLRRARRGLSDYGHLEPLLRKLSLFSLTGRQVGRIIAPEGDGLHAFQSRKISPEAITANPYLLCENYVPATDVERLDRRPMPE
jgi:exodeoxyribonuclease V alpha subunit